MATYVLPPPSPYSAEGRIASRIRALGCAESNFAKQVIGIAGKSRIAEALADARKPFSPELADRLLEKVAQMEELQTAAGVPVDWSRSAEVANALTIRLVNRIGHELGSPSQQVADAATRATEQVHP